MLFGRVRPCRMQRSELRSVEKKKIMGLRFRERVQAVLTCNKKWQEPEYLNLLNCSDLFSYIYYLQKEVVRHTLEDLPLLIFLDHYRQIIWYRDMLENRTLKDKVRERSISSSPAKATSLPPYIYYLYNHNWLE